MANEIPITIHGNLTKDPELQTFPDGTPYVNFTVANTPRRYDRQTQQWKDSEATFFNVKATGQLAANMAHSLTKGSRVIIEGTIAQRAFQGQDGQPHRTMEITATDIGASFLFATATINRNHQYSN